MKDSEIRVALHARLRCLHRNDTNTIIVDELAICQHAARVDVAVVSGEISGFEIKSDHDTLSRLPAQQEAYGRVFDFVTIISGSRHIKKLMSLVPDWWGILEARQGPNCVELVTVRDPTRNSIISPLSLAQLLWREEALGVLAEFGLDRGMKTKSRRMLWERLASSVSCDLLAERVRSLIKARGDWRSDRRRARNQSIRGGRYTTPSTT